MRVVAGELGGRRLKAPPGAGTRPTADKVREALFSILGDVSGLRVLDLFAGSGALGIEALSRGAAEAVFVDKADRAVEAIRGNLAALGLSAPVVRGDALSFLASASDARGYGLVLIDPPYDSAAGLAGIGFHECRHSYSSFLDAAGISETRADRYMGHSNHGVANRYRHPSEYAKDAERLDEYLSASETGKLVSLEGRAA